MKKTTIGLLIFIAVVAIDAAGLLLDWFLEQHGFRSITATVGVYPVLGVALVAMQILGAAGLAYHFWGSRCKKRISRIDPRTDLPCEWCKEVKSTTVSEIWSEAYPEGRLVRLCEECGDGCAGG